MKSSSHYFQLRCVTAISPSDRNDLISSARALKRAALSGSTRPLLRGKNIGLMCDAQDSGDAEVVRCAATELGARVAQLCPSASGGLSPEDVQRTARMLGRLYDAIECQVPSELVQQLSNDAGVPVYDGIASTLHPSAALVEMLDGGAGDTDNRRYVLQALLVSTIGQT